MEALLISSGLVLLAIIAFVISFNNFNEKEDNVKIEAKRILEIHDAGNSVVPYTRTLDSLFGVDFLLDVCREVHKQRPDILISIRPRSD